MTIIIDKNFKRPMSDAKDFGHKINTQITSPEVRLIGKEGESLGIMLVKEALHLARQANLDLVEVSSKSNPPTCKIIDYRKHQFEQKKRTRELQKKQKKIQIKEVKFRPNIDQHDFEHKLKQASGFISKGCKVKISLVFRGREIVHKNISEDILKKIKEFMQDKIQIEKPPSQEGRQINMLIGPVKE